jgi:excinuclease ABC subunit A
VVVIEHELDLVKNADHIVDLGPEGGEHGGELVAAGTPEEVARTEASHTGKYLRDLLPAVDLEGPRGDRVVTAGADGELVADRADSEGDADADADTVDSESETAPRADDD